MPGAGPTAGTLGSHLLYRRRRRRPRWRRRSRCTQSDRWLDPARCRIAAGASFGREIDLANDAAVVFVLAANEIAKFRAAYPRRIEPLEDELRFQIGGADRRRKHGGEP